MVFKYVHNNATDLINLPLKIQNILVLKTYNIHPGHIYVRENRSIHSFNFLWPNMIRLLQNQSLNMNTFLIFVH